MNQRLIAVRLILSVLQGGRLNTLMAETSFTPFTKELVFGVLRFFGTLNYFLSQLLEKPLRKKDDDINVLLCIALYEIHFLSTPQYATVSEAVNVAGTLKKVWAKQLVNGVLREFIRKEEFLVEKARPQLGINLPDWLREAINTAFPNESRAVFSAFDEHPPLTLRVNPRKTDRESYQKKLMELGISSEKTTYSKDGLNLKEGMPVEKIPYFNEGFVSVQDEAAQLAVDFLAVENGMRVLDACAAPGGKLCHLLEHYDVDVDVIEISDTRAAKIYQNLQRLELSAQLYIKDATVVDSWWNGAGYDRIMLDAPCSATGIIRRQPDIKIRRTQEDIALHQETNIKLLHSLWPCLNVGGSLLYITCSILPEENEEVIKRFLGTCKGAVVEQLCAPSCAIKQALGLQCLPGVGEKPFVDGLYFCRIRKEKI